MATDRKAENPRKPKRNAGRPRTGSLYWTKSGWRARVWVIIDGVSVRQSHDLGTTNKTAARAKLRALLASAGASAAAATCLSLADYAQEWLDRREKLGVGMVGAERKLLEVVWIPALGTRALDLIRTPEIQEVLDSAATGRLRHARGGRYSRQSIIHIRGVLDRLCQDAWRAEIIPENRVRKTQVPAIDEVRKARAVLTDAELGQLVAHPDVDAEIKVLVLLSRTIGGLRAGDLNALDWAAFGPEFATCTFVRRKTRKRRPLPETFEVPEPVRAFVAAWHEAHNRPGGGPVFPVRKGRRAGEQKKASNMSYADRLRRELTKAGLTRHELHHETATTLPVDFHSTRRAYASSLARVGLNAQQAMQLTGHSDPRVHQGYVDGLAPRTMPAAALPPMEARGARLVLASSLAKLARDARGKFARKPSDIAQCRRSDLNRRPHAYEARALTS